MITFPTPITITVPPPTVRRCGHDTLWSYLYNFFGYDIATLTIKVARYLNKIQEDELLRGAFVDP